MRVSGAVLVGAILCGLAGGCTSASPSRHPHAASTSRSSSAVALPPTTSPTPGLPSVPADVPTTGSNVRPGEKPPVMPLEATHHTAAGAKAFATFFVRVIDWEGATVSSAYLRHYSSEACLSCRPFVDNTDSTSGRRYVGGRMTIETTRLSPQPLYAKAEYTALVVFDIASFQEWSATGGLIDSHAAYRGQFEVSVIWVSAGWSVTDLRGRR